VTARGFFMNVLGFILAGAVFLLAINNPGWTQLSQSRGLSVAVAVGGVVGVVLLLVLSGMGAGQLAAPLIGLSIGAIVGVVVYTNPQVSNAIQKMFVNAPGATMKYEPVADR
jgi:tetrahydromethanopterin S-methyltransferase subunit C